MNGDIQEENEIAEKESLQEDAARTEATEHETDNVAAEEQNAQRPTRESRIPLRRNLKVNF